MAPAFSIDINKVKGFLSEAEGNALYESFKQAAALGPALEIGSYCGKSTLYLAAAAAERSSIVFAIDHHTGSEEHQPGEMFHDPALYDGSRGQLDSFREFRSNLQRAGLQDCVIPIVASSASAARFWSNPLGLLFIDGGHSLDAALGDYRRWPQHLVVGGILAIHDVYASPEDGGQAPRTIWQMARDSGLFEVVDQIDSLALLKRL